MRVQGCSAWRPVVGFVDSLRTSKQEFCVEDFPTTTPGDYSKHISFAFLFEFNIIGFHNSFQIRLQCFGFLHVPFLHGMIHILSNDFQFV